MIMDTRKPFIITISRELGSGGHTIGKILAERLGVRYSDKELIQALREQFHLTTDAIERLKGEKKDWLTSLLQKMVAMPKAENVVEWDDSFVQEYHPDLTSNEIFKAEKQILQGLAEEGSCVIAGRSGFFVLKDFPNKVDIFITAPREKRIQRVMAKQHLPEKEAAAAIDRVDKGRENYIKRYTGTSRYDARNYDLVITILSSHSESFSNAAAWKSI